MLSGFTSAYDSLSIKVKYYDFLNSGVLFCDLISFLIYQRDLIPKYSREVFIKELSHVNNILHSGDLNRLSNNLVTMV